MQTREQINADWRTGESNTDTNIRNIVEVLLDIRDVICGKPLEGGDTVEKCGCAVCEKKLCHKVEKCSLTCMSTNHPTTVCHNKKEEITSRCLGCDKDLEVDCTLHGKALFNRETPKVHPCKKRPCVHDIAEEEVKLPEMLVSKWESDIDFDPSSKEMWYKINSILEYLKAHETN